LNISIGVQGCVGGLRAVEVVRLFGHRLEREQHQREILGPAARHHRVRRNAYRRRRTEARRYFHDRLVEIAIAVREHALDALGRRAE
jgi:hypothetical protein